MSQSKKMYTYLVTISQTEESFMNGNEFGPKDEWASFLKHTLDIQLLLADVVEVKPTRNRRSCSNAKSVQEATHHNESTEVSEQSSGS